MRNLHNVWGLHANKKNSIMPLSVLLWLHQATAGPRKVKKDGINIRNVALFGISRMYFCNDCALLSLVPHGHPCVSLTAARHRSCVGGDYLCLLGGCTCQSSGGTSLQKSLWCAW